LAAYAITAVLGFAAFAKLSAPAPSKLIFGDVPLDYVVAGCELAVIMVLLPLHRWKLAWGAVAVMFGGFAGYASYWTFSKGQPCGCFGDLWHPPLGLTVALDAAFVVVGILCAWRFGMGKKMLRVVAVAAVLAGVAGSYYAYRNSPEAFVPKPVAQDADDEEPPLIPKNAQEMLWYSDLLAEQRGLHENQEIVATYIFVYEVGCSTCEMYKPQVEAYRGLFDENADMTMRVVMVSKGEAEEFAGIEIWAWESAPVSFVAYEGSVIEDRFWFVGEETPFDIVEQVYEWASGGAPIPY
jgi:hypothetical protein